MLDREVDVLSRELSFVDECYPVRGRMIPQITEKSAVTEEPITFTSIELQRLQIDLTECSFQNVTNQREHLSFRPFFNVCQPTFIGLEAWKLLGWESVISNATDLYARRKGNMEVEVEVTRTDFEDTPIKKQKSNSYTVFNEGSARPQLVTGNCIFRLSGKTCSLKVNFNIHHEIYDRIFESIVDFEPYLAPDTGSSQRYKLMEGCKLSFTIYPQHNLAGLYKKPNSPSIYVLTDSAALSNGAEVVNLVMILTRPLPLKGVFTFLLRCNSRCLKSGLAIQQHHSCLI